MTAVSRARPSSLKTEMLALQSAQIEVFSHAVAACRGCNKVSSSLEVATAGVVLERACVAFPFLALISKDGIVAGEESLRSTRG